MTKTCTRCGFEFPATREHFYSNALGKYGLRADCKSCFLGTLKLRPRVPSLNSVPSGNSVPSRNREYRRQWKKKHRSSGLCRDEDRRQYEQRKQRPEFRIGMSISRGMRLSIHSDKAGRHWESLVNYTVDELKVHLEAQFAKGMTWDNYGKWHIDHIIPRSFFHFESSDDPEFLECWSLWNLRPLWGKENISRGNRVVQVPLPLL